MLTDTFEVGLQTVATPHSGVGDTSIQRFPRVPIDEVIEPESHMVETFIRRPFRQVIRDSISVGCRRLSPAISKRMMSFGRSGQSDDQTASSERTESLMRGSISSSSRVNHWWYCVALRGSTRVSEITHGGAG